MRTDLSVPFAEKDEAKRLGARFDMGRRVWYVPDGVDLWHFKKWLPASEKSWMATHKTFADSKTR